MTAAALRMVRLVARVSVVLALLSLGRSGESEDADDSLALSAEEAAPALLLFHLMSGESPPGYQEMIAGETVGTPATPALPDTAPGADPFPLPERRIASGLIAQVGWRLSSANRAVSTVRYSVALYRDDGAAGDYARGDVQQQAPLDVGDAGVSYRYIDHAAVASQRHGLQARWQRGRVVFLLDARWGDQDVSANGVPRLVELIDGRM